MIRLPVAACSRCMFDAEGLLHATLEAIEAGNVDEAASHARRALDALLRSQDRPDEPHH